MAEITHAPSEAVADLEPATTPAEVDESVIVGATPPDPPRAMPSRRAALLRSAIVVGILLLVFVVILPRFVDYQEVAAAFRALTFEQVLLMTLLGVAAWVISGVPFRLLVPELTLRRAATAYIILGGIAASIPFGPWNMGVVWVVFRGWGVSVRRATSGIALYGVLNELSRLVLPVLAVLVVALTAATGADTRVAVLLTVVSTAIFVVVSALLIAIIYSDRGADWLGRTGQRVASRVIERLGRSDRPDVDLAIHRFRDQLGEVIRRRGSGALVACIAYRLTWCLVLIVALRVVGVPDDVLAPYEVLAVYALVSVITIIPISPGGAGVPELLYIAGLTTIAGSNWESLITAGVFLFRLYQWFLPIPLTWILLKAIRRGGSLLPTTAELRSYMKDEPAAAPQPVEVRGT